jgi:hypothetical protein
MGTDTQLVCCIWEGVTDSLPFRIKGVVPLLNINQLITPVSTFKCRVNLYSGAGEEILPCDRCLAEGFACTVMFYTLRVNSTSSNSPTVEFDLVITCDGTDSHNSGYTYRLLLERY